MPEGESAPGKNAGSPRDEEMEMNRAYSVLEIKAVDDDQRVITGIATTPEPDRIGDIVDSLGATFANPLPLLWQHRHDMPVGTVVLDKPTKNGIKFKATLPIIEQAGMLKDLVDMAWQSVKAKLVRGVSIGFRSLERNYIDGGGMLFAKTEIMELSLVTVPANASATIQTIKAMDTRPNRTGAVRLLQPKKTAAEALPGGAVRLITPA